MSLSDKFEDELKSLRTLRDELRVQVNLAQKEAHDLFQTAEKKWDTLESKLERIGHESAEAVREVGEAASLLADEIRDAYRRIREEV
jgi:uncharacterized protein YoxC